MCVCVRSCVRAYMYECMHVCPLLYFDVAEEKSLVNKVFTNAIDCLSDEDKKLPQVCTCVYIHIRILCMFHSGTYNVCATMTYC